MRFSRPGTILYLFSLVLLLWILFLAVDYVKYRSTGSERLDNIQVVQIPRRKQNFLFIESSCAFDKTLDYKPLLTNRQACSIESAARTNPQSTVFYFFTCLYHEDENLRIVEQQALSYRNVKAVQINTDTVFQNTPLDSWYGEGELLKSKDPNIYAKEVLKALILWKYGGVYLDLDFMIFRSIDNLENFLVRGEGNKLEFSILGLDSDGIGNQISSSILEDIRNSFKPNDSSLIGSDLLFRAMEDLCGVSQVNAMTSDRCEGVTVLPTELFIPLQRRQSRLYVYDTTNNRDYVMELLRDCYGAKMWEERTNTTVFIGSDQPYSLLAEEYCPRVFQYSVNAMTSDRCEGVTVLPTELFIPLQRRQSRLYVYDTTNNRDYVMELLRDCYGAKMWEERTNTTVFIGSDQPYSLLAEEYCPRVFQYSGNGF